ncbi:F-box protein [[Candida] jaroonii]|uniref:F-box protein n=1 Tax=[Candida] jaroonii TaxID=467808 RepID=A0ACA9YAX8_9ASCO|nr:F-box protein [[Candida] jaroonii]
MSQFEKVDVLRHALTPGTLEEKKDGKVVEVFSNNVESPDDLMVLPTELILYIFEILYYRNQLKPKFLRISKLFHILLLPMIYNYPVLKATNFFAFVETISNNKKIGEYVKQLDLSYIIQSGKNAFVAKLLKRSKKNLINFVAPQTSFGLGPLFALRNCEKLKILDLRLVSETLNLNELFNSIRNLKDLEKLSFPRSSIEIDAEMISQIHWPPKLSALRISGGISDEFLVKSDLPLSITHLEFAHCPMIKDYSVTTLFAKFGKNLKTLKIEYPMPKLKEDSLDSIFRFCPNLTTLLVYVDYISGGFFDDDNLLYYPDRPLRNLYIDSSGMLGTSTKLHPLDLALALTDGRLPNVKNIRCTAKLGWDPQSEYVSTIIEILEERNGGLYLGY